MVITLSPLPTPAENTAAIQVALDSGAVVDLGGDTFTVAPAATGFRCLTMGAGSRLRNGRLVADVLPPSYRLVYVTGPGASMSEVVLDGSRSTQTVDEQRHGVFVTAADFRATGVTAENFTGDGFYLYAGSAGARFVDCTARSNDRNGMTLGSAGTGNVLIMGGEYSGNAAQQIDSEPGAGNTVNDVRIVGARIVGGADYAVTVSGSGSSARSARWTISGCSIVGSVHAVWADDVAISGNVIEASGVPCVSVYRRCSGVSVVGNSMRLLAGAAFLPAVRILGTSADNMPERVVVGSNCIDTAAGLVGIGAQGVVDVTTVANSIRGGGGTSPYVCGVYARATITTVKTRAVSAIGNSISGYPTSIGAAGYSTAKIEKLIAPSSESVNLNLDGLGAVEVATPP